MHGHTYIKLTTVLFKVIFCLPDITYYTGARGGVVVKALRYKPAGRGFDSRWGHWNFSVTIALGSTQPLTEMSTRCISWG